MKRILLIGLTLFFVVGCAKDKHVNQNLREIRELHKYIDPWIGVKGSGACYPGPQVPFGSINPGPDSENGTTGGYNVDTDIFGFSQLHVSGTGGASKYGNFLLSPQIGIETNPVKYKSSKTDEESFAGYFKAKLTKHNIVSEITSTHNAALYRFIYPESDDASLLIDMAFNIPQEVRKADGDFLNGNIEFNKENNTVWGNGYYAGGYDHESYNVYFFAQISKKKVANGIWEDEVIHKGTVSATKGKNDRIGGFFKFKTRNNEKVYFKIAVSLESVEQARGYLENEISAWDFNLVRKESEIKWDNQLSSILIDDETATETDLKRFYTMMYHSSIMPRKREHTRNDGTVVSYWDDHYCIWDTYRSFFPLYTIINENFVASNINAFLYRRNELGEKVTDTYIAGNETAEQGGNNVDVVIADAFAKNISGVDWSKAYKLMKFHADFMRVKPYLENNRGWVPAGITTEWEAPKLSKTVEYNYNDFNIAMLAKHLNKPKDYKKYLQRSSGWENIFKNDEESDSFKGFLQGKSLDGNWENYDPKQYGGWGNDYFYESNSWTYSFYVPQNYSRLIEKMGGNEMFVNRLNHFLGEGIVQFHNEPSFLAPFLFNYAGRPDLTSYYVEEGVKQYKHYFDASMDGGDEDVGAMGTWYIFSKLGFFPVAGSDIYLVHGAMFKKITIQTSKGKNIIIEGAPANSQDRKYVESFTINGKPINKSWFKHSDIIDGTHLKFNMTNKAIDWAKYGELPPSGKDVIDNIVPPSI